MNNKMSDLTKVEWLAGHALSGLLANPLTHSSKKTPEEIAGVAAAMAEHVLRAINKPSEGESPPQWDDTPCAADLETGGVR